MNLFKSKVGLVMGIANKHSIATHTAQYLAAQGARLIVTYFPSKEDNERHLARIKKSCNLPRETEFFPCNVANDEDIDTLFDAIRQRTQTLDFVVHSLAWASTEDLANPVSQISRTGFNHMMSISVYSFIAVANKAKYMMSKGSSLVCMSHIGAEKVVDGFNAMGIAKAALQSSVQYLAKELGQEGIRVNCVSAGPVRTLSSFGISNFSKMKEDSLAKSPLQHEMTQQDIAKGVAYLLSDLARAVTAETLHVDNGYNTVAL